MRQRFEFRKNTSIGRTSNLLIYSSWIQSRIHNQFSSLRALQIKCHQSPPLPIQIFWESFRINLWLHCCQQVENRLHRFQWTHRFFRFHALRRVKDLHQLDSHLYLSKCVNSKFDSNILLNKIIRREVWVALVIYFIRCKIFAWSEVQFTHQALSWPKVRSFEIFRILEL